MKNYSINQVARLGGFLSFLTLLVVQVCAYSVQAQQTADAIQSPVVDSQSDSISATIDGNNVLLARAQNPDEKKSIEFAAKVQSILLYKDTLYVALGNHGMQTFQIDDTLEATLQKQLFPQGNVTGFFLVGDNVWMQLESVSGVPVNEWQPAPSPESSESATRQSPVVLTPPPRRNAVSEPETKDLPDLFTRDEPVEIRKVGQGEVLLNVGAKDGVRVSHKFSVFRQTQLNKKELGSFDGREQVAVLTVTAVNENSCLAKLPRGDRVFTTDIVAPYEREHTPAISYPRRTDHLTELAFALRPLINVDDTKGAGALVDLEVTHYGAHSFVNVKLGPSALGFNEEANVLSLSLLAQGGYDSRAFAVGLGAGVALVNGNMDRMLDRWDEDNADESTKGAFALSQFVRLGARDGLNLTVQNTFFYYHDKAAANSSEDDSGFVYGGTTGKVNIPLNDRMDLFFNGGGGRFGYAFGEVGIFAWVRGNGDAGSLGISAAAGGAGMWMYKQVQYDWGTDYNRVSVAGPMVSLGFAYRFGNVAKPTR